MKESYTKPDITVDEFKAIGVITTSDPGDNSPDTDIPVPWS